MRGEGNEGEGDRHRHDECPRRGTPPSAHELAVGHETVQEEREDERELDDMHEVLVGGRTRTTPAKASGVPAVTESTEIDSRGPMEETRQRGRPRQQ